MAYRNTPLLELGGREYRTTIINGQLWMAENLALMARDSWFYEDNARHGARYGRLYSWHAAMEACPEGWRLPQKEDWESMISSLGGKKQALPELLHGGSSGFDAIYAGYRTLKGDFLSLERASDFWTATSAGEANAWLFYMIVKKDEIMSIIDDKRCGFSVRYLKDI